MKALIDIGDPNAPPGSEPWCRALLQTISRLKREGEFAVSNLKYSLTEFRKGGHFKRLFDEKGKPFKSWKQFVPCKEPYGLGMRLEVADAIINETDETKLVKDFVKLDEEDRAKKAASKQGRRTDLVYSEDSIHEVDGRPSGTSRAAALRRLRKDRPDIHKRVLAGELSPHAGMVEAGFRKRRERNLEQILKRLPKLTPTECRQLRAHLDELIEKRAA